MYNFLAEFCLALVWAILKKLYPPLLAKIAPKDFTEEQKEIIRQGGNPFRMKWQREK